MTGGKVARSPRLLLDDVEGSRRQEQERTRRVQSKRRAGVMVMIGVDIRAVERVEMGEQRRFFDVRVGCSVKSDVLVR